MRTCLEGLLLKEKKEIKKRSVAKMKRIREINKDDDLRVSIIGSVVNIDDKNLFFTIDDGKDRVNVLLNNNEQLKKLELGKIVRIIGIVMGFNKGFEIRAEVIQDFRGIKIKYYNKLLDLIKTKN